MGKKRRASRWSSQSSASATRRQQPLSPRWCPTTRCDDVNTDNLTAMGLTVDNCADYRKKFMVDFISVVCTAKAMGTLTEGFEDGDSPPTADEVKSAVAGVFEENPSDEEAAESLRLFETAMKTKKWPTRLQPWSSRTLKFGGAAA